MALELRPNCEYCDWDLPPASELARICSYECTFCADCVEGSKMFSQTAAGASRQDQFVRQWSGVPDFQSRSGHLQTSGLVLSYSLEDIAAHCLRIRNIA